MTNLNSQTDNQCSEAISGNQQTSINADEFKNADDLLASVKDEGLVNLNEGADFPNIFTFLMKVTKSFRKRINELFT